MIEPWAARSGLQTRLDMGKLGWHSNDKFDDMGSSKYSYTIWFTRWDWHGQKRDQITFYANSLAFDDVATEEIIEKTIRVAAARGRLAWDKFTDPHDHPHQNARNELVQDEFMKRTSQEYNLGPAIK